MNHTIFCTLFLQVVDDYSGRPPKPFIQYREDKLIGRGKGPPFFQLSKSERIIDTGKTTIEEPLLVPRLLF
ncbi:hypothetical protein AS030_02605 [Fictibacillus enclensis]|uniref:Uncharacterized protein n=1 Tax=Fictibacillus enclensis TaxID=1017270 RepID=A0A0V8JBM8_9BACL|nr:hypothetical protein AS030_02605 [Fictibacillus enclensis]